jgi:hypothetical protein
MVSVIDIRAAEKNCMGRGESDFWTVITRLLDEFICTSTKLG